MFVERPLSHKLFLLSFITKKRSSLREKSASKGTDSPNLLRGEHRNDHTGSPLTLRCLKFPPSIGGSDPHVGVRTMHLGVGGF